MSRWSWCEILKINDCSRSVVTFFGTEFLCASAKTLFGFGGRVWDLSDGARLDWG